MSINIYIGWDSRFPLVSEVAGYSLIKALNQNKHPLVYSINYVKLHEYKQCFNFNLNPTAKASTEFTYTRFLIPWLCEYKGLSVFVDNDVLFYGDLLALIVKCREKFGNHFVDWPSIICRKHLNIEANLPKEKMYGTKQVAYGKKNWSSFMLLNNQKLECWTKEIVEQADGMRLHQFRDIDNTQIYDVEEIETGWNILLPSDDESYLRKMIHYTEGGPWFKNYFNCRHAALWKMMFLECFKREFTLGEAI